MLLVTETKSKPAKTKHSEMNTKSSEINTNVNINFLKIDTNLS